MAELHKYFYEINGYKRIRDLLDDDGQLDAVQRLSGEQPAEFTDYLNFFEFIAYLRYQTGQLDFKDIEAMFDYYLRCLRRHQSILKYINDEENGFENLRKLVREFVAINRRVRIFVYGTLRDEAEPPPNERDAHEAARKALKASSRRRNAVACGVLHDQGGYPTLELDALCTRSVLGQMYEFAEGQELLAMRAVTAIDRYEGYVPADENESEFRRVRLRVTVAPAIREARCGCAPRHKEQKILLPPSKKPRNSTAGLTCGIQTGVNEAKPSQHRANQPR